MYLVTGQGDGILFNLASLIILVSILSAPYHAHGGGSAIGSTCAAKIIRHDSLVRIDQDHKRIFIVMKSIKQPELKALIQKLESCFTVHEWNNQWSLSVFSDKRIAGYKDEPNITPFHKKHEWAKGYLAEYSSRTHTLILAPATSPKKIILQLTP
jgi:hypothetical protein